MGSTRLILAAALVCGILPGQSSSHRALPVPKIWDDAALEAMTLPPAIPEGKIIYLPAAMYYKHPLLVIYKHYPVYHPDREPPGYLEWLRKQEPQVVFDATKLASEEDWISAGRIAFHAATDFVPFETIRDRTWFSRIKPPATKDGVVPAYSYVIRTKGLVEIGTGSCSMCHSRVLPDGTYVPGAQGNLPVEQAYAEVLRRELPKRPPARLATGLLLPSADVDRFTESLYQRTEGEVIATFEAMLPGVAMRPGFSYRDPPKIADLIGVRDRHYLDMTARFVHHSAADIARYGSACPAFNYFFSRENTVPEAVLADTNDFWRYTDEQAYAFARYVYSLRPPPNPNEPSELTRKGEAVFRREGCPACHTPPLYTNNKIVPAGNFTPPDEHRNRYDILDMKVGTDAAAALHSLRGRGYYKVPSLKGVWYRGPFVHNGTIATLEDWFDPKRLRTDYVPSGYKAHGVLQRAVPGHPFGLALNSEDRAALIAFLRTL